MSEIRDYVVWGEYGPTAYDSIKYPVLASSKEEAKEKFITLIKEKHPVEWGYMGKTNVYC